MATRTKDQARRKDVPERDRAWCDRQLQKLGLLVRWLRSHRKGGD